jgi:hypothetical protein
MELNDLKALMAACLLGGSVTHGFTISDYADRPTSIAIAAAVKTAQEIWNETLKQDRQ